MSAKGRTGTCDGAVAGNRDSLGKPRAKIRSEQFGPSALEVLDCSERTPRRLLEIAHLAE